MLAGRSIARSNSGCPLYGRVPARRSEVLSPVELDCDPYEPDDPDVPRVEAPEDDPPELEPDPLRCDADPEVLLDDDEGVRDPSGV